MLQREREIGIRVAVGARAENIARLVTTRVSAMVIVGALAGLIVALGSERYVATLLYRVKSYRSLDANVSDGCVANGRSIGGITGSASRGNDRSVCCCAPNEEGFSRK